MKIEILCGIVFMSSGCATQNSQSKIFWPMFATCQAAEAADAVMTYNGIRAGGMEGQSIYRPYGPNPRNASAVVDGSIIVQAVVDLAALGLRRIHKKWSDLTANAILGTCTVGHGYGATTWIKYPQ